MMMNYIILDAARCGLEHIDEAVALCRERQRSLYIEKEFSMLQRVAPYLLEATGNKALQDWFLEHAVGNSWGIGIQTDWNFEATFDHFRRFLKVKNEDEKQMLFRFYDPRVLKIFLPTCTKEQKKEFFGKVDAFVLEEEEGSKGMIRLMRDV